MSIRTCSLNYRFPDPIFDYFRIDGHSPQSIFEARSVHWLGYSGYHF